VTTKLRLAIYWRLLPKFVRPLLCARYKYCANLSKKNSTVSCNKHNSLQNCFMQAPSC